MATTSGCAPLSKSGVIPPEHEGLYGVSGRQTDLKPIKIVTGTPDTENQMVRLGREQFVCSRKHKELNDEAFGKCGPNGGQNFTRYSDVKRHHERCSGSVTYACPVPGCGSGGYAQSSHVKNHIDKVHTPEGDRFRYECLLCRPGYEHHDSSLFHRHFDEKHPEHAYKLRVRGKKRRSSPDVAAATGSTSTAAKRTRQDSAVEIGSTIHPQTQDMEHMGLGIMQETSSHQAGAAEITEEDIDFWLQQGQDVPYTEDFLMNDFNFLDTVSPPSSLDTEFSEEGALIPDEEYAPAQNWMPHLCIDPQLLQR